MKIDKIYIGGWFQRTTLHLSEIYDFIKHSSSPLGLDKKRLAKLQKQLHVKSVEMKLGALDYIEVLTDSKLTIKIYEDGLIVLNKNYKSIKSDIKELTSYYEKVLSPGISYIFSLGAPNPKELANIKTIYPYFIVLHQALAKDIKNILSSFGQSKYYEKKDKTIEIFRGDKLYIINNKNEKQETIEKFIHEQIFFREFKGQLHRYLNLHRIIWEKIADVKERGEIKGIKIGKFKSRIESYNKTINLIGSRINQMGSYIGIRGSIVKSDQELERIVNLLEFKYDTLSSTLAYIKEIWEMTKNYVDSALALFSSIQAESTKSSVENLTVITSMGVGATLIGLFASDSLPVFTWFGVIYFLVLVFIGWSANKIMENISMSKKYKISDVEIDKEIK